MEYVIIIKPIDNNKRGMSILEVDLAHPYKTELIENYVKEKSLSEAEFCNLCRITPDLLRKIYKGDITISVGYIFRIAKTLGVKPHELLNDELN